MGAFPPVEIATKLLVSLGIGLLVGFEREWAHKDLGVRTFAIVSLLGMLSALLSQSFVLTALAGVIVLVITVNVGSLVHNRPLETTTSGALLVTYALGVLVGEGHVFTPTASAIVMTLLLAMKPQFSRFAGGLTEAEVRGAVLLGLIGFVAYPVLPNRFVDPWELVNPREAWLTIILISAIGFANYVLLRLYSTRGLYYAAIFGGLVNSTATVADLSSPIRAAGEDGRALGLVISLLTTVAMLVRNLAVLAIIAPSAGLIAVGPILLMVGSAAAFAWWYFQQPRTSPTLTLGSPVRISTITKFGLLFLVIQVAATLAQRFLGSYGAIAVSFVGGFASSASTTAAAASLSMHDKMTDNTAAISTVVTSIASAAANVPILYRQTKDRVLLRRLLLISASVAVLGLLTLGAVEMMEPHAR